jgi:O-antigen/teichoic acid export membrane protein
MMSAALPFVLFLGGGIVEAVVVALVAAALIFIANLYSSSRLLPELYGISIDRAYVRPMMIYGGGWLIAAIAGAVLFNLEKFFLTRLISVKALAYYSVAFTFASTATMFSQAMIQSLVPAFSRLSVPEKLSEFDELFSRGTRFSLLLLLPGLMFLAVIAKPFFTIWAGPEFGQESTVPFYVLLCGLLLNILSYVPFSALIAVGRTDLFAKLYWLEVPLYAFGVVILIRAFGIAGAAMAWSLRVILDAFVVIWMSKRFAKVTFRYSNHTGSLVVGVLILTPPMLVASLYNNFSSWLLFLVPACISFYGLFMWKNFADENERDWFGKRIRSLLKAIPYLKRSDVT